MSPSESPAVAPHCSGRTYKDNKKNFSLTECSSEGDPIFIAPSDCRNHWAGVKLKQERDGKCDVCSNGSSFRTECAPVRGKLALC